MSRAAKPLAFRGTICHTPKIGSVEVLQDHLLVVNADGYITHLGPAGTQEADSAVRQQSLQQADIKDLTSAQLLLPGFIDTHCHAPQYAFTGLGTDLPLFDWLQSYTFPCEASFSDIQHAGLVYRHLVQRLLRLGTTTANYFTTLHEEACKVLVDVVLELGQRAVIGKVSMDQHGPDFYVEADAEESLQGVRSVVDYIKARGCRRVTASVTPRFIPTCSQHLLSGLGQLAQQEGLLVHSHISESRDQVEFSQQLHPGTQHDAAIYNAAGLLTHRSIFAHGTQLTPHALQLMAERGAAVAYCPLSNFYFGDGLFCVARALAYGVKVGLGTDVAGGYSPSMLQAMRMAVINSHALKAGALMAQQQQGLPQQYKKQQQRLQEQQQHQQEQAGTPLQSGERQPLAAVAGQPHQQKQDGQQPADGMTVGQSCRQQPQDLVGSNATLPSDSHSHGAAAGLAGSRVAAAINSPAVSAAALQHQLSWEDSLYLATAGGAAALGLEQVVGQFAVGMAFDALLVDCAIPEVFDVLQDRKDSLALLEHFLHNGDDRNIINVWVQGRSCKPE